MAQDVTRSWFVTFSNPEEHGYTGTPEEICERLRDEWIGDSTTRSGAWAYCISAAGLRHVHMVVEDAVSMRFSAVKKSYAVGAHFEPTKGSKKQAEDYINKRHPFNEKGEEVVCIVRAGTILGAPGKRTDLDYIGALLEDGLTPQEIMDSNFAFRRFEKEIKSAYFRRLLKETPTIRDVAVHILVGESGTGKTHHFVELCEQFGEDSICFVSDFAIGGLDHYEGEPILYIDEYKGQYPYSTFLTLLDKYKAQVHSRYINTWCLWSEVYITSVFPPETLYELMVPSERRGLDSREQMYRRITDITYCYRTSEGEYKRFTIPMCEYKDYETLVKQANSDIPPLFRF